jgi:hypothetical protein
VTPRRPLPRALAPLLAAAALAPAAPAAAGDPPLVCPAGTELRGAAPEGGYEQWCEGKDPLGGPRRSGPARTWYDSGVLWTEGHWRDGLRDGPFVEYHRNGRKARAGRFERGDKAGRWTIWYESGQVEEETGFRAGMTDGPFTAYWPNGKVRTMGRHCGGAQCGTWRSYDQDGHELGTMELGEQTYAP